jgi:hypothetical protein
MSATDAAAHGLAAISVYLRNDAAPEAWPETDDDALAALADAAAGRGLLVSALSPSRRCAILRGGRPALLDFLATMDAPLAARIAGVFGPDDNDRAPPVPCIGAVAGDGDMPAVLGAALPPGDGAGHCVGLLGLGGGIDHAALAAGYAALGIAPPDRPPHVVAVDAARVAPEPGQGPLLPMLLLLAALVPRAKLVVYVAPPTTRGWIDALSAAIHDADNRPSVLCCGWRLPDPPPLAATLAAQAAALLVRLALPEPGRQGTATLASGQPGHAWGGAAIDAALDAAALLRQAAPPPGVAAMPAMPAPPRPHFDALTVADPPADAGHAAFVAYDTDRYPGPPAASALPMAWGLLPGSMAQDIAAGGGAVWALSGIPVPGGVALYRWTPAGWLPAQAGGTALAVDAQGRPWLADALGTLLRFTGNDWRIVGSGVHDVALDGAGGVWALSGERHADGRAVLHRPPPENDDTDAEWPDWTRDAMRAERIAVAPDGTPWIVTGSGAALRRDGAAWLRAEGIADRIAVARDGSVFAITPHALVAVGRVAGDDDEAVVDAGAERDRGA